MDVSPRDLLSKISKQEREFRSKDFLAPYFKGMKTAIVKMDGIHYRFRVVGFSGNGIGIFRPINPLCARYEGDADYEMTRNYFDVLPHLHVILAYESDQGWVAYPFNMESTSKKFALEGEILVLNVSDAERFDVITVRFDGAHFWCDELFAGGDVLKSQQMREAFDVSQSSNMMRESFDKIKNTTPEDQKAFEMAIASWNYFKTTSVQSQIEYYLSGGGATLCNYIVRGANIDIKWKSKSGEEYNSVVNKETFMATDKGVGVCINGEDKKFHLKDFPFIINKGEEDHLIYRTNFRNIDSDNLDFEDE